LPVLSGQINNKLYRDRVMLSETIYLMYLMIYTIKAEERKKDVED